ncbi:MAG: response regulator transcription factor [Oscillospiraceae bacterium]|nr:response regulator transcription factor [Oscillospiraceae bacterium]MBR6609240.1 response regulator transcription factor [Oscillospiraceae bacterium]
MKILMITQTDYRPLLTDYSGFSIKWTAEVFGGIKYLQDNYVDLVVIDDGVADCFSLCTYFSKSAKKNVLFICHSFIEETIEKALVSGATDFVVAPFEPAELAARIKMAYTSRKTLIFTKADITVDAARATVKKAGENVFLSQMEYRLLLMFMRNQGKVFTREEILSIVWEDSSQFLHRNTLTVYIKRLRQKLEDNPNEPEILKTIRGTGYYIDR